MAFSAAFWLRSKFRADMITLRAYVLLLFIPILLVVSMVVPASAILAGVLGVAIVTLIVLDRQYAGDLTQFAITREHDAKLSLGVLNPITLRIESSAPLPTAITVHDEAPLLFLGADKTTRSARVGPRESYSLEYSVRPLRRGDFRFGAINVRWHGPSGLYVRQGKIAAEESVPVYPNLYEMRKYDLLVRRDQVTEMGLRNVRQRGQGTAFESLRDYTPDDPYRSINWKATARRGKPISTDFEPERSQRVIAVLDIGRMMRSPLHVHEDGVAWDMAKVDFVINSVLLFAYVATLKGDQVGLLVFADKVQTFIPPKAGRAHFQKLLDAMYALESQPVEADYSRAVRFLEVQNKKRSLLVLFTDLSGSRAAESLLTYVPRLAPRHIPLLVTIRDPALDTEAVQRPGDSASVYRRAVAEELIDERKLLLDRLGRQGVLTLDVDARHLTMAVVNRYLQIKARL
jgi:uncharacterized protein (DUF58 family)